MITTRIIVIGFGPVAARLIDGLTPSVSRGELSVMVFGHEPCDAYNRVLVGELAVGRCDRDAMTLSSARELHEAGVTVELGRTVTRVDRSVKTVTLDDGRQLSYDRLVFATGARANVPSLNGITRAKDDASLDDAPRMSGVSVLRDVADATVIARAVASRQRIIVLGAGILGMEFALAASEQGADVTIVHTGHAPLPRQLDADSGRVLVNTLRSHSVTLRPHSRVEEVLHTTHENGHVTFRAVVTADGAVVSGDLLVLSCGSHARTELATRSGLATARGILVDAATRTWDDPDVFAIGDCAQVIPTAPIPGTTAPGSPPGLIGPGWAQADRLIQVITDAGMPQPVEEEPQRPSVVTMKASTVDVSAVGDTSVDVWDSSNDLQGIAHWLDPQHGRSMKLVTHDGKLVAFACVGLPRAASELALLYSRRAELPADRSALLRLDGAGNVADRLPSAADEKVCQCNGVSAQTITDAVRGGCHTVTDVSSRTRAGTGCGGCIGRITDLINASAVHVD
ncbi:FAD-dependent oxidoreductase [Paramicrobacterium fandaimingii]|uniref:FAD-dependent oxidoreductase n=1 Tax=Paramicrobacterium fandaimingii TaxID=2708079 RepID=UPI001F2C728C|nr:FAD-dependent oxidoreductase [Microbacterium fandaimingii]